MYERFTVEAKRVMQLANQEAQRMNSEYTGTEHILLGLINEENKMIRALLEKLKISRQSIREKIQHHCQPGPPMMLAGTLPQTPRAKKVIEIAMGKSREWDDNFVGVEHLFMGVLIREEGIGSIVLMELGITIEKAERELVAMLGKNKLSDPLIIGPELQEALAKLTLLFGLSTKDHVLAIEKAMLCAKTMIAVNNCVIALHS